MNAGMRAGTGRFGHELSPKPVIYPPITCLRFHLLLSTGEVWRAYFYLLFINFLNSFYGSRRRARVLESRAAPALLTSLQGFAGVEQGSYYAVG